MKVLAADFGGAEVYRLVCDACGAPVLLAWRGEAGTYCSEACMLRSDAARLKVKIEQPEKVKTNVGAKVKSELPKKPDAMEPVKVKIEGPPKVKIPESRKVKAVRPVDSSEPKVKIGRNEQRIARRAAIRRIRREI